MGKPENSINLESIELAVRERQISQARSLIASYLKHENHSLESRLRASEYYRRFSDYHSALKILGSERSLNDFGGDSAIAVSAKLHLARVLNLLGASTYALRILTGIRQDQLGPGRDSAIEIYNSNYIYKKALSLFGATPQVQGRSYKERLGLLSLVDAYFGSGLRTEAIELLDELLAHSSERILVAISNQIKGSFLLLTGKASKAEKCLEESAKLFGDIDNTLDRGYLDKWIGALLLEKKNYAQAKERLTRAWKVLYRPGFKPEGWLEVMYWQGLLSYRVERRMPEEWSRIACFPSPTRSRFIDWIESEVPLPQRVLVDAKRARKKPAEACLDLESNVLISERGGVQFGLNMPELLAGLLVRTSKTGLPLFRASETLWPDELFSFEGNLKRMEQVILRARREHRLSLLNQTLHLKLDESPALSCLWVKEPKTGGWIFLREHETFTREQVQSYFGVSKRMAVNICNQWIAENYAVQEGKNRASVYRRRSSLDLV